MRNNLHIYHKVLGQFYQWLPDERISRKRNVAQLITGIYWSAAVHLALVVRAWPITVFGGSGDVQSPANG